jgi:hypothetical protein
MNTHGPTTYTWADVFTDAVTAFQGDRPTTTLEQELLTHFQRHPAELVAAIDKTKTRYANGKIHSPWAIIRSELRFADRRHEIQASDHGDREQATRLTELHITNAGLYLPTEDELLDDAFGDHGRLEAWADDEELRARITTHWHNQRSRAESAEQSARDRGTNYRARHQPPPAPQDTPPATPPPLTTAPPPAPSDSDIPL